MDEFYKRKALWIGLGALAIIFLCVMACLMGAFFTVTSRSDVIYGTLPQVQLPADGESAAPPAVQYYWPMATPRHVGFSPFSALFKILLFGLMVLLFVGLLKRIFWGHRHWAPYHRGHYPGRPPAGMAPKARTGKHPPHPAWGPWAWHGHGGWWAPEDEPEDVQEETGADESDYSGPQE